MAHELAISVDGPTASGKTTLANAFAASTGATVLDTGLTYRAVAYAMIREPLAPSDHIFSAVIRHQTGEAGTPLSRPVIVYHDEIVTDAIWSRDVEEHLPSISADSGWRRCIAAYHRRLLQALPRVVAVGRDCASSIMTDAVRHVFLTAALPIRRERRRAQYRDQPDRAVSVKASTALDHATRSYVGNQPNGLILDTTFLPRHAPIRAVLVHMGVPR